AVDGGIGLVGGDAGSVRRNREGPDGSGILGTGGIVPRASGAGVVVASFDGVGVGGVGGQAGVAQHGGGVPSGNERGVAIDLHGDIADAIPILRILVAQPARRFIGAGVNVDALVRRNDPGQVDLVGASSDRIGEAGVEGRDVVHVHIVVAGIIAGVLKDR